MGDARLSYDIARCAGTTAEDCRYCRRREPGRAEWQANIAPAWTVQHGCQNRIEPPRAMAAGGVAQLQPGQEITIAADKAALFQATQEQRDAAVANLFVGLTNAITRHGCEVNIDDPSVIRVRKS